MSDFRRQARVAALRRFRSASWGWLRYGRYESRTNRLRVDRLVPVRWLTWWARRDCGR